MLDRSYFSFKLQKKVMAVFSTVLVPMQNNGNNNRQYNANNYRMKNNYSSNDIDPMYIQNGIRYLHIYQRTMTDIFKIKYSDNASMNVHRSNNTIDHGNNAPNTNTPSLHQQHQQHHNAPSSQQKHQRHYTISYIMHNNFNKGALVPRYFTPTAIQDVKSSISRSFSSFESLQLPQTNEFHQQNQRDLSASIYYIDTEKELVVF